MALIQNIKTANATIFDVRSYLNIHHIRPLFDRREHVRLAKQSCVFRGYDKGFDGLDERIAKSVPSVQRMLNLYVSCANVEVGDSVHYEFKRVLVKKENPIENLSDLQLHLTSAAGLLVINRYNLMGGMSVLGSDIRKELPPGHLLILDNSKNTHRFTELEYIQVNPFECDGGIFDVCMLSSSLVQASS